MGAEFITSPSEWLRRELLVRRKKNSKYSLRAFAAYLKISPGRVSELLSEKRKFTVELVDRISKRLGTEIGDKAQVLASLKGIEHSQVDHRLLREDEFELISEWQHFAILSLLRVEGFVATPKLIAKRLGISLKESLVCLRRLERMSLVEKKDKVWTRSSKPLKTTHDISSQALRKFHTQILEKAIWAIAEVPIEKRDVTSVTLAIDPSKLKVAKELTRKFRKSMEDVLETGNRTEVYSLGIQLIPLST